MFQILLPWETELQNIPWYMHTAPLQPGSPLAETALPPASPPDLVRLQGPWVTACQLTGFHTGNKPCDSSVYGLSQNCQLLKC